MICNWYSIAGKKVRIFQDWQERLHAFEGFEIKPCDRADITVRLYRTHKKFEEVYGVEYYKCDPDMPHLFLSNESKNVRLMASSSWSLMIAEGCQNSISGVMEVFLAGFYSFLAGRGGVLVHASLIRLGNECVMFTGPSGIGKTTQAELWKEKKEAEILNGDKVILLSEKEKIEAWGSPWRGSSPYGENEKGNLRAIVVLEQGPINEIRKLSSKQTAEGFFPHVFYPFWDENCVQMVLETMQQIYHQIPVYKLSCLPNEDAVKLAYDKIWGEIEC